MSKDKKSNYYDAGEIETIDVIKAKLTLEQYTGYLLGNAIKYACRLNFKGSAKRDSEKLKNYSRWVADQVESKKHVKIKRMVEYPPQSSKANHDQDAFDEQSRINFCMSDFPEDDCGACGCSKCDRDYIANIERSKHNSSRIIHNYWLKFPKWYSEDEKCQRCQGEYFF
jgi:hypothetical protein